MRTRSRTVRYLVGLALVIGGLAGTPAPAAAASCTYPTFSLYPGSATGFMRYGQVDVHFDACDVQGSAGSITRQHVNATGQNLGFFINGASVRVTGSPNSYTKWFTADIHASTCTPRIGWPCSRSYSFSAQYTVSSDRWGNPQVYQGSLSAPIGMRLFTTP
jgi:hypothetical protein